MSEAPLIQVENVSKVYHIWNTPASRLTAPALQWAARSVSGRFRDALSRKAASSCKDFWALSDINLTVGRGESVGIIGRNGSGKSTLLQIIAGTLQPTSGRVERRGRVAALLELGSGFNPDFTGRENAMLNGVLLGLSRREIEERYEQIAGFADIGDFIDQPVKTYSSGMMVRLAFAVAISVEPDILIVDEALSVGDVFFTQKCFRRVHELLDKGVSLLFVSHDTAAVQNLCTRALLLKEGRCIYEGPPEEAASRYYAVSAPAHVPGSNATLVNSSEGGLARLAGVVQNNNIAGAARSEHGARDLAVTAVTVLDRRYRPSRTFRVGEPMHILLLLKATAAVADPSSGIHLFDRMNNLVFAAGTRQLRKALGDFAAGEERLVEFILEMAVNPGEYTFSVGCAQASVDGPNHGFVQHRLEGLGPVTVIPAVAAEETWPFYGMARLPLSVSIHV